MTSLLARRWLTIDENQLKIDNLHPQLYYTVTLKN